MNWNKVWLPGCDVGVSKSLKDRFADLTERVAELDGTRRDLDQQEAAAKGAELSPELIEELGDIRIARIVTWQTEVALRNDIDEWLADYREDLRRVDREAFKAIGDTEADVISRLVGIGYVEVSKFSTAPGKIQPGMIHVHPDYLKAQSRRSEVKSNEGAAASCHKANRDSLAATNREMEITKGLLSTASAVA